MKPYFDSHGIQIYCGDSRDVLRDIEAADAIVTDPVWPNASVPLYGSDDPIGMFRMIWDSVPALPARAAVHLGCDSDPRFLLAVPVDLVFFRVAWLEIVRMGYKGRLGMTGDVAYLFGDPPPSRPGQRIIPGRFTDPDSKGRQTAHPCPRKLAHVKWLVKWWTSPSDLVVDPFAGSGTTLVAALHLQRRAIGIEIDERWCEMSARRIESEINLFDQVRDGTEEHLLAEAREPGGA